MKTFLYEDFNETLELSILAVLKLSVHQNNTGIKITQNKHL
jgi:hypothetical protein